MDKKGEILMNNYFNIPTEIIIGAETINKLPEILNNQQKCLLVTTENVKPLSDTYDLIKQLCPNVEFIHFDEVMPNPSSAMIDRGVELARKSKIDVILAVGGGSTLDTAKTIRLLLNQEYDWNTLISSYGDPFAKYDDVKSVPYIAVPTTTGTGSEVTQAAVVTHNDFKESIFHNNNYADIAILDPTLVISLPKRLTAMTTFDAFTHAFESYISPRANAYSKELALRSIDLIIKYLPKCLNELDNVTYREKLLVAQNFAGMSLATGGANLPHPLSEVIGSICHIAHGEALAIVFPNFIEKTSDLYADKYEEIKQLFTQNASYLEEETLADIVRIFIQNIELRQTFSEHDVTENDFISVVNHPLWDKLPFLEADKTREILRKSK